MNSYEVHGLRVSSTAVRAALAAGDMQDAAALLGRPYAISGHVVHGRKLGRKLGERGGPRRRLSHAEPALSRHWKPAASGIFVVRCMAWARPRCPAWPTWACALAGPERRQRRACAAGDALPALARAPGRRGGLR
jgi:riboflavin kinase/FMN adenylyltransferase